METNLFNMISVIIATIAAATAIYVIYEKKRYDTKARRENLASISHRFSEGYIRDARKYVWIDILPKWFKNQDFREKILYYTDSKKDDVDYDQRYGISDLIDFYAYIYRLIGDDQELLEESANQYFYDWWRGFLLSYILTSRRKWEDRCHEDEMRRQLSFHKNFELIIEFDIKSMKVPFKPECHIYYKDYAISSEIYPGLDEHNRKIMEFHRPNLFMRKIHRR